MDGSGGNQALGLALGVAALNSVDHLARYFSLQRRHPDGHRWLDIAHYSSRSEAKAALAGVVQTGHFEASELRVIKVVR